MRSIIVNIAAMMLASGTAAAAADASSCELHVWPAARMTIGYDPNGWAVRNQVIKPMPGLDADALMLPAVQNQIIAGLDLAKMLDMPGAKMVLHDSPLPLGEQRSNTRRAVSGSACYAELIVLRILYAGVLLGDRQLQTFFLFRRFDGGAVPTREFSQSGDAALHLFPPQKQDPVAPAVAELSDAFGADVRIFAAKVGAPPAPPRSRGRVDW